MQGYMGLSGFQRGLNCKQAYGQRVLFLNIGIQLLIYLNYCKEGITSLFDSNCNGSKFNETCQILCGSYFHHWVQIIFQRKGYLSASSKETFLKKARLAKEKLNYNFCTRQSSLYYSKMTTMRIYQYFMWYFLELVRFWYRTKS